MRTLRGMLPAVAAALLILAPAGALAQGSDGHPTPEDAIAEYLAGVAGVDTDRILAATAIDEISEGYQLEGAIGRIGGLLPFSMEGPAEYPFYADINRATWTGKIMRQTLLLSYSLLSDAPIGPEPIFPVDAAWAADFVRAVDPARLSGLQLIDIRQASERYAEDERVIESLSKQAALLGADETAERRALIELGGDLYQLGFRLVRYGDAWMVEQLGAPIIGLPSSGVAVPTTAEEFERDPAAE